MIFLPFGVQHSHLLVLRFLVKSLLVSWCWKLEMQQMKRYLKRYQSTRLMFCNVKVTFYQSIHLCFIAVQLLSRFSLFCYPMDWSPPGCIFIWDFSGNIGVDCHFLLQGIFPTQRLNLCLLHWQVDSLSLSQLRSPHLCLSNLSSYEQEGIQESHTITLLQ